MTYKLKPGQVSMLSKGRFHWILTLSDKAMMMPEKFISRQRSLQTPRRLVSKPARVEKTSFCMPDGPHDLPSEKILA
ncbi:hypothetical protein [Paenibacillus lautus]|jgi:hypothetical protein|uniref:hypothetical protein n=1 Tax=Paenibacillus lautus TaxID=1401 RepID=UPI0013E2AA4B|nr:hypothetical protein [Paenibacillus lautus]